MIAADKLGKPDWFSTTFRFQGSVLIMVLPSIVLFCSLTVAIILLYAQDIPVYFQKLGDLTTNVIYNLVLGLLLVFRTNTSYDRFWEGRKAWGLIVLNARNLAQSIQIGVSADETAAVASKTATLKLLTAFAIAAKLHLRAESANDELKDLLTPEQLEHLRQSKNMPLDIAYWIRSYFQRQFVAGRTTDSQVVSANEMVNNLLEGVSGCERIITTPIPIAYRIYLKRLIFIYCLGLPFRLVPTLVWWSIPTVAVISFLLFGVEEVGRELENPFGYEANDLPLDEICKTISSNVESTLVMS